MLKKTSTLTQTTNNTRLRRQTPEICLYIKQNEQRLQPQNIWQNKIMAFKGKLCILK